ncbi:MAG: c-type cytochrome [Nitrososphaeraceae archaeon]
MFVLVLAFLGGAGFFRVGTAANDSDGDPRRGAQLFQQCAACHSVRPGEHLTGPSLARVWGLEAGTVEGFTRYSEALKKANIAWNAKTLDAFLKDPQTFIPSNRMPFPGIQNSRARTDLIAFLKAVNEGTAPPLARGMMAARPMINLKQAEKERQVTEIRYCDGNYHVKTAAEQTIPFWEFNLRFKTDSSDNGPLKG